MGTLLEGEKKKKGGIKWADAKSTDHPTSDLFPSPHLVQPQSPELSFPPGKPLVGSAPQLNKLQNAYVHGEGFNTPAPPKLQACFRARFTPAVEERVNLQSRFAEVSSILKSPKQPSLSMEDSESEAGQSLNSTFTLDEAPMKKPPPPVKRPVSKRKMSMIPGPMSMQPKRNTLVSPFPKPTSSGTGGKPGVRVVPRTAVNRPTTSTLKRPAGRPVPMKTKK